MKIGRPHILFLVLVLGGVGLFVLYQLANWLVIAPWAERFESERRWNDRIAAAKAVLDRAPHLRREWAELGGQTYALERGKMIDRMYAHLNSVMEGWGNLPLTREGAVPMVTVRQPRSSRANQNSAEVEAQLSGVGKLDACFRVLYELARDPHLGRVESATIRKAPRDLYKLDAKYIAKWLDQPTVNNTRFRFELADLSGRTIEPFSRTKLATLSEKTMFTQWQPPVVIARVPMPVATRPEVIRRPPEIPQRPVEPPRPPAWESYVITALHSAAGDEPAQATVHDPAGRRNYWQVRVGDELADGRVLEINAAEAYLALKVGLREYIVEVGGDRRLKDRVPRQQYRPTPRIVLD